MQYSFESLRLSCVLIHSTHITAESLQENTDYQLKGITSHKEKNPRFQAFWNNYTDKNFCFKNVFILKQSQSYRKIIFTLNDEITWWLVSTYPQRPL